MFEEKWLRAGIYHFLGSPMDDHHHLSKSYKSQKMFQQSTETKRQRHVEEKQLRLTIGIASTGAMKQKLREYIFGH